MKTKQHNITCPRVIFKELAASGLVEFKLNFLGDIAQLAWLNNIENQPQHLDLIKCKLKFSNKEKAAGRGLLCVKRCIPINQHLTSGVNFQRQDKARQLTTQHNRKTIDTTQLCILYFI